LNIKEIIEPEQKHQVRGNVRIASSLNNRVLGNVLVPSEFDRANEQMIRVAAEVAPAPVPNDNKETNQQQNNPIFNKCLAVMNNLQIPDQAANQICTILSEALQSQEQEQQQPKQQKPPGTPSGNVTQQGPPISGQFGAISSTASGCPIERAKQIAKLQEMIDKNKEELGHEKLLHQANVVKIASLEKHLHTLKLENYLRRQLQDEQMVAYQAARMASKGMTIEDLKEIYESIPPRKPSFKSRVKLRVASTAEDDDDIRPFRNKKTNNKIMGSFFNGNGYNNNDLSDDYDT
jgi:hypothetical protein